MASELRITTLANNAGTESVDTAYVINGSAKQWAKTNSAGTSILDSHNTSSITDNGTGDQTITITNAMANTQFAISIGNHSQSSAKLFLRSVSTPTTTTVFRTGAYGSSAYVDCAIGTNIQGDLA